MPADRWTIGDVTITAVIETTDAFPGPFLREYVIPDATPEALRELPWLAPSWVDEDGEPRFVTQALLVESQGVKILVDTCLGNDKDRKSAAFHKLATPFVERLAARGAAPRDIAYVMCTHLHFDHVGWNTRWSQTEGRWVPTFERARYLFARSEWQHWSAREGHSYVIEDSIRPVFDAGLVDLVETDHVITEEVSLLPTPGHTPGHVSVRIRSRGAEAVITGDMMHHPCQIARPEWTGPADSDRALAEATRRDFLREAVARGVVVVGTHFAPPAAGRLARDDDTSALSFVGLPGG